jgi:hypothetical protein
MQISRIAALLLVTVAALAPRSAEAATTVSVRDFGAAGDGVVDDTPAIQRAIDAVGDAGVVLFPPGTYQVTQLRVGSRIALVGAAPGAVTFRNTAPAGRNFSGMVTSATVAGGVTDVEIRNLTFDRTVETDAFDEHVYLENCRRVVIENSRFVGRISRPHHAQKGVHLRGCRDARILNNVFEDIADNALALNWLDAATVAGHHVVSGNVFARTSGDPASQLIVTQSDVTVVANVFRGQAPTGLAGNWIETGTANGTAITALSLTANSVRGFSSLIHDVHGLVAVGNVLHNALLNVDAVDQRSRDVAFVGNVATGGGFLRAKRVDHVLIEGNVVTDSTGDGIMVQEASQVSVLGNRVRRAQRSGVFVDGTTGAVIVADNACDDNGQGGIADAGSGVLVQNAAEATLVGNVCHDTQGGRATQRYGLVVNATRTVTLRDNLAAGNRQGAYREVSPPAEIRRSGNSFDAARDESTARRLVAAWSPPRLAPGTQTIATLALPGAELGDLVVAGFSHDLRGLQLTAYVSAKNSITVVLRNGTADTATLPPGRVKIQLLR